MIQFIGTQTIMATVMTLGDYNHYRGWSLPFDEDPKEMGYLIERPNGSETWMMASAFLDVYRCDGTYDFGHALFLLKQGARVSRAGWNGKGMWIALTPGSSFPSEKAKVGAPTHRRDELLGDLRPSDDPLMINCLPHIDMRSADGDMVIGWLASQTDMLARDWGVVTDA